MSNNGIFKALKSVSSKLEFGGILTNHSRNLCLGLENKRYAFNVAQSSSKPTQNVTNHKALSTQSSTFCKLLHLRKMSTNVKTGKEQNFLPFSDFLTDTHGRHHNYLRISITEKCNLRYI